MRLPTVARGRRLRDRLLFGLVRLVSGHRAPDVVRTLRYAPDVFGRPMNVAFQRAMRGPSAWSVGERELFAALVSSRNQCVF
jgi:hypothetical protein